MQLMVAFLCVGTHRIVPISRSAYTRAERTVLVVNMTDVPEPPPSTQKGAEPSQKGRRDKRLWAGGATEAWKLQPVGSLPTRRASSVPKLRAMLKDDPDNFLIQRRLVETLLKTKQPTEALKIVEECVSRGKDTRKLQALKCYVLSELDGPQSALSYLRGLPEGALVSSLERLTIEFDLLFRGQIYDEAERVLSMAMESKPTEFQTLRRCGRLAVLRKEWDRAVEILEPLMKQGHSLGRDAFLLGAALVEKLNSFDRGWQAYCSRFSADLAGDAHVRLFFEVASRDWIRTNSILNLREAAFGADEIATLERRISRALASCEPFALIRLLDGEGRTLEGSDRSLDGAAFWDGHIEPLSSHEMEKFQGLFLAALKSADVLGLPNESMVRNPYNRSVISHLDGTVISRIRRGEMTVADQTCHFQMQMAGSYERLLSGRDFVGVVAGRDLSPFLTQQLHAQQVAWHRVPGQARHDGLSLEPHYPVCFDRIRTELKVPYRGAVYVVAAGIVGKVYCAEIKRKGGVAIDIGAVADVWAGRMDTRPFLVRNQNVLDVAKA